MIPSLSAPPFPPSIHPCGSPASTPSSALAVVPRDYPSIQDAVRAVQGAAGARVRIDSDATFEESLTITDSVTIAAGSGYRPTIRGTLRPSATPFPGHCVLDVQPAGPAGAIVELIGLTLVPAGGATRGDRIVQLWNRGTGVARLHLSRVQIDNRGGSADGLVAHQAPGAGSLLVSLEDSLLRLGGAFPVSALSFRGAGTLILERSRLAMNAVANRGLTVSGPSARETRLLLRDSTLELEVRRAKLASTHLLLDNVAAQIERNGFVSRSVSGGLIFGLTLFGASSLACPIDLHQNAFTHQGEGRGTAIRAVPQPFRTLALRATNNLVAGQSEGFVVRPALRASVRAVLAHNTIDRTTADAVHAETVDSSVASLHLNHNVITRSGGYAARLERQGGSLSFGGRSNGYFGNALGDVQAPYSTAGDGVAQAR